MRTVARWIGIVLGLLGLISLILWFGLNSKMFQGYVAQAASRALGRSVSIEGDLRVTLFWSPRVRIERLRVANTAWSPEPFFLTLQRLDLRFDLRELLRGRLGISTVEVVEPVLRLEKSAQGEPNWRFDLPQPAAETGTSLPIPILDKITLKAAQVLYMDYASQGQVTASFDNVQMQAGSATQPFIITGQGQLAALPLRFTLQGAALQELLASRPTPVEGHIVAGPWRLNLAGRIDQPGQLQGVDIGLAVAQQPADAEPPLDVRLTGHLKRAGEPWIVQNLAIMLGHSDFAGQVLLRTDGPRPWLRAELFSRNLDGSALLAALPATAGAASESPPHASEPASALNMLVPLKWLRAVDARVDFQGETVGLAGQTFHQVTVGLEHQDGRLVLTPTLPFGAGTVRAHVTIESRDAAPLQSAIRAEMTRLDVPSLLAMVHVPVPLAGELSGHVDLTTAGHSPSQWLSSLQGTASLNVKDQPGKTDVQVILTAAGEGQQPEPLIQVEGQGRIQGEALQMQGHVGTLRTLSVPGTPYPVRGQLRWGKTEARVDGTLHRQPQSLNLETRFWLQGPDPATLSPLLGHSVPHLPAYRISGHLSRSGSTWGIRELQATMGASDLRGNLTLDLASQRPVLRGTLQSKLLAADELLRGFQSLKKWDASQPISPLVLESLRSVEADLSFKGNALTISKVPLTQFSTSLTLHNGQLSVTPAFRVTGGTVRASAQVQSQTTPMRSTIQVKMQAISLQELLTLLEVSQKTAGQLSGRIDLTGRGNSLTAFLATADGNVLASMPNGQIGSVLVELLGLDVGEVVVSALAGNPTVPIRCMIADFTVRSGKMSTQMLLIDTTDTKVIGGGFIDLKENLVGLKLEPESKDWSLFSAESPLYIYGSPSRLSAGPKFGEAFLSLLSPIKLGGASDANCQTLIEQIQRRY